MTKPDAEDATATVRLKLLDPLGRAITGLKYEIRKGSKVVAQGVTDAEGVARQFVSEIGESLSVHVEHFLTKGMTQIRELTPWTEKFSVKLVSGKVKQTAGLAAAEGSKGSYRRKTYEVISGDTLTKIGKRYGLSAQALADFNQIRPDSIIQVGQVLKLPVAPVATGGDSIGPSSTAGSSALPQGTRNRSLRGEPSALNGPEPTPVRTEVPPPVPVPRQAPPLIVPMPSRGESGTPKTAITTNCESACIKLGDKGPLIEELNIRLAGFGGTVSAPAHLNEFTEKTASAVKQFQRDYMAAAETGKVCGSVLRALDEFRLKYPVDVSRMKCRCGHCDGFGNGYTDSAAVEMYSNAARRVPYRGTEYPGVHRALLWGFRAALFYIGQKDKSLGYSFLRVSSGYRCWHDNKLHSRQSTNHMGNALDLQFRKGDATTRCSGSDVDHLRAEIFVKRLGAQLSWPDDNKLSLETAAQGATSWVHMDVREYEAQYKDSRYYAINQAGADGDSLAEMARREGRLSLLVCGGVASQSQPVPQIPSDSAQRIPVANLTVSAKGLDFVKAWETCKLEPYDDSEGFCTIGWGHLIDRKSCSDLKGSAALNTFRNGVTQGAADDLFAADVRKFEDIIKERIQVPLFQHEYDALTSLIFNLGGFRKCPKLLSKLNTGDYAGCCDEFADITNGGNAGLVKRRRAEMKIFRNKVYDASH